MVFPPGPGLCLPALPAPGCSPLLFCPITRSLRTHSDIIAGDSMDTKALLQSHCSEYDCHGVERLPQCTFAHTAVSVGSGSE